MIETREKKINNNQRIFKNALFIARFYLSFKFSTFNELLLQTIQFMNEIFRINNNILRDQINNDS